MLTWLIEPEREIALLAWRLSARCILILPDEMIIPLTRQIPAATDRQFPFPPTSTPTVAALESSATIPHTANQLCADAEATKPRPTANIPKSNSEEPLDTHTANIESQSRKSVVV
jgi:hypothetical protein